MTTQTPDPELVEPTPTDPSPTKAKVRRPGWTQPSQDPSLDPSSPDPVTDDGSAAGPDSVAPSEQMPDDKPQSGGSSRTSSRADRKALQAAVRVAVAGATTGAHELLIRDPYAKHAELLLADEQDLEAISEPGGNMLARRMKDAPIGGDLADGIGLAIAVAGYLLKQVARLRYARQLREGGAVVGGLQYDAQADEQPPAGPDFPLPE